ncbi:DNA-directed DNA polymerase [Tanacetum coccineum]
MVHMPKGAKVLKDLLSHKEKLEKAASSVKVSEECFAIIQRSLPQKERDLGSFTLPCLIGPLAVKNALADLGASINLMPHSLFRRLGISKLKPTKISIQLPYRSIKYPIRVCENLLVKASKFIFLVDFVVLEIDEDELVPIILGRPFLTTERAIIDVHKGKLSLRAEEEEEEDSNKVHTVSFYLGTEPIEPLEWKAPKNRLKPSSVKPPKLELKELSEHLELLEVLKNHKGAIAWSIADIKGIDFSFCTYKILIEDEFKPCVQTQRRVNPNIKEVVPKKGGITVVNNEEDELILQRTVTRWCVLDIEIRDKKGVKNLAADHLSRLENPDLGKLTNAKIRDLFLEEQLMAISNKNNEPWYADYANYLASRCAGRIIRRCVAREEAPQILRQCHSGPSGGHHGIATTMRKVFKAGFYWPHIFRDALIDCMMAKIAVGEGITRSVFKVKGVDLGEEEAPYWTTLGKNESYKPRPHLDGVGAQTPYYARKDFLDCHLPKEWEIARDAELNSFKDTLVFRRMVEFLGAIPINLKSNMWKSEDLIKNMINWYKPPKDRDEAWHAKIRLIDPDGEEFTKTL